MPTAGHRDIAPGDPASWACAAGMALAWRRMGPYAQGELSPPPFQAWISS